jgi:PilZ domain
MGRLRGSVGNRRRAPRFDVRLSFSVSIVDEKAGHENTRPPQTLVGRTRNLSETGVALVVPSLRLGTHKLNDVDSTLRLMLDLPAGTAEIHVVPVRSHQLAEKDMDSGHFIGAKITHLSDEARARLTKFLRSRRSPR